MFRLAWLCCAALCGSLCCVWALSVARQFHDIHQLNPGPEHRRGMGSGTSTSSSTSSSKSAGAAVVGRPPFPLFERVLVPIHPSSIRHPSLVVKEDLPPCQGHSIVEQFLTVPVETGGVAGEPQACLQALLFGGAPHESEETQAPRIQSAERDQAPGVETR